LALGLAAGAAGTVVPVIGNASAAAGGAIAGFGICLAELALEAIAINHVAGDPVGAVLQSKGTIDQKLGEVIPPVAPPRVVQEEYRPPNPLGESDPNTGDPLRGPRCTSFWCRGGTIGFAAWIVLMALTGDGAYLEALLGEPPKPRALRPGNTPTWTTPR
jgi:hypothetical protein